MDLTLTSAVRDGATVISAVGEIDVYTSGRLRSFLLPAVEAGPVVVDLEGCEFLDVTGLGVLIGARKLARANGWDLAFACTVERVLQVFRVTGLMRVLTICESVDEAVKAVLAGKGEDDG